jgi:hypothetical protein
MTSKGRSNSKQLDQEREQHQVDENNEFWLLSLGMFNADLAGFTNQVQVVSKIMNIGVHAPGTKVGSR